MLTKEQKDQIWQKTYLSFATIVGVILMLGCVALFACGISDANSYSRSAEAGLKLTIGSGGFLSGAILFTLGRILSMLNKIADILAPELMDQHISVNGQDSKNIN